MKDAAIKIQIEQLAVEMEKEINSETAENYERVCRLHDGKEYLRRAWHSVDGSEFAANDTAYEQMKPVNAGAAIELLTHRLNVSLRALTLIHEMAKKRARVNMQDGTSLELFASAALKEANQREATPPVRETEPIDEFTGLRPSERRALWRHNVCSTD